MADYKIETMTASDVRTAVNWAGREGWNPGLHDAETFFVADNSGFFKGTLAGEIIATGSAVIYDDSYAFCGLYIVAPEHRGKGYGLALTKTRLAYCGDRNVGIDGVLENVRIYERIGYKPCYENCRFEGEAKAEAHDAGAVHAITAADFDAIRAYDRLCFPAHRDAFLKAWLGQGDARAVCFKEDGVVTGYAVRRKCLEGHKVGPLFADDAHVAETLFGALQADIEGEKIILDTPENNPEAIRLATLHGMKKVFATARMYQKGLPDIRTGQIFGITTFELG
ncbi:GNAT family N-acetyltransferase [Kordiimonas lacus]|uniref:Acetyltransferase (GNAT) family protein n=1 Tax=Kordiimonas lacus TaxID=637679 RepID=A0A1G6TIU5_9PROT|nr:GNAT family N-acetyltransferase [Kordiimonas lacus]SDD28980.1 Acetyltransferase (GNAT) family protein [Kordiimonas lacus]